MGLTLRFVSPDPRHDLTFEDDGRVAYAYLRRDGRIVGDVWLYNRCHSPIEPEWDDLEKAPFANPKDFVSEGAEIAVNVAPKDIAVTWETDSEELVAYIYLFGDLIGVVGVDDKPGYARFAAEDGPLAQVMKIDDD